MALSWKVLSIAGEKSKSIDSSSEVKKLPPVVGGTKSACARGKKNRRQSGAPVERSVWGRKLVKVSDKNEGEKEFIWLAEAENT